MSMSMLAWCGTLLLATAPAEGAPPRRGHVRVDATELGERSGGPTTTKIQGRAASVLAREGVIESDDPSDAELVVAIGPLPDDSPGYRVAVHVTRGGETIAGSEKQSQCRLCTEDEMVALADELMGDVASYLEVAPEPAAEPEPKVEPEPSTEPEPEPEPRTSEPRADHGRVPLGPKGKAGAALLAIGGAALVSGIVLVVREPQPHPDQPYNLVNTRPPGIGVLAGGVAVAVTGAVLLGLDRAAARKRRATAWRRVKVQGLAPWIGPMPGASVRGRF